MKKNEFDAIYPALLEMDDVKTHVFQSVELSPQYTLEINCGNFTIDYEYFNELCISTNDGTPIAPYIPQITNIVAKILDAANSLYDDLNCYELEYDGIDKNVFACKFLNG